MAEVKRQRASGKTIPLMHARHQKIWFKLKRSFVQAVNSNDLVKAKQARDDIQSIMTEYIGE
jgi:hypothetical protein